MGRRWTTEERFARWDPRLGPLIAVLVLVAATIYAIGDSWTQKGGSSKGRLKGPKKPSIVLSKNLRNPPTRLIE